MKAPNPPGVLLLPIGLKPKLAMRVLTSASCMGMVKRACSLPRTRRGVPAVQYWLDV